MAPVTIVKGKGKEEGKGKGGKGGAWRGNGDGSRNESENRGGNEGGNTNKNTNANASAVANAGANANTDTNANVDEVIEYPYSSYCRGFLSYRSPSSWELFQVEVQAGVKPPQENWSRLDDQLPDLSLWATVQLDVWCRMGFLRENQDEQSQRPAPPLTPQPPPPPPPAPAPTSVLRAPGSKSQGSSGRPQARRPVQARRRVTERDKRQIRAAAAARQDPVSLSTRPLAPEPEPGPSGLHPRLSPTTRTFPEGVIVIPSTSSPSPPPANGPTFPRPGHAPPSPPPASEPRPAHPQPRVPPLSPRIEHDTGPKTIRRRHDAWIED
ncbi:hypothetical protein RSAG8_10680, partial [Rhizoctonia solani AG-8 WAC10335]